MKKITELLTVNPVRLAAFTIVISAVLLSSLNSCANKESEQTEEVISNNLYEGENSAVGEEEGESAADEAIAMSILTGNLWIEASGEYIVIGTDTIRIYNLNTNVATGDFEVESVVHEVIEGAEATIEKYTLRIITSDGYKTIELYREVGNDVLDPLWNVYFVNLRRYFKQIGDGSANPNGGNVVVPNP